MERIIETVDGIQNEESVKNYDLMQRDMRDKGIMDEKLDFMLSEKFIHGKALEVGPGPDYFGLEWLKATKDTSLCGIEISKPMVEVARKNAKDYNFADRASYYHGDAANMEFEDNSFDIAFVSFSMHEWDKPVDILREIGRVLKPGGRLFIIDFRRDVNLEAIRYIPDSIPDEHQREGFFKSVYASYTEDELKQFFLDEQNQLSLESYNELVYGMYLVVQKK